MTIRRSAALLAASALCTLTAPAQAKIPEPVRAMIDAAIASGEPDKVATVIELARQTNPEDGAELDAIMSEYEAERQKLAEAEAKAEEREIRQAGLFDNWRGQGQLGAFRSTGNSNNTGLTAGLELERVRIDWRHKLTALADYQRTNGVTTREQFLFAYEPSYDLSDRLFLYGFAQYERDRFQGFSARYSASGGLGYRVIEGDDISLSVRGGPAWRRTERLNGITDTRIAGRAALDFDWQIAENIKLTEDVSAFLQSGNSTYISTTGIVAGFSNDLSARVSYSIEHDTNPPPGAVGTDTLTRVTLVYDF